MDEAVSATDVKRKFSIILRGVLNGQSYVVMSQGRAVARIVPSAAPKNRAHAALLSRLERQPIVNAAGWTRDDAYQDER
ncbi:type II toxin-antitoxin system Phd/YefM family antitoxin [Mesorhizobium sp. B1-1-8]|uniref:type II toxin-antitoxin system Phd/YefM family antitoxin n=1 Tax=Mesorhizobium sp. B1-1-8 TaxID=2589976 RepID=UPI0011285E7B|nr:type II toxin-antitoxin system prevent-host-death family antitoxin [Mesorhizobium sp. B1-1-8]UCI06007.1 type II toxin-antitoxin system prevent-host-death family antitoxin [Mesorhizobium sp. B1-1-8]